MDKISNVERWTEIGIMDGVPEDRKEAVANGFEFAYKFLMERENSNPDADTQFETISFPIIRRIVEKIDLSETELLEIINYCNTEGKDKIRDTAGGMDYEAEFGYRYAEIYVENYKHKNKKL
jgi:hypothetical protein